MAKKQVIVTIATDGTPTVEVNGVKGQSCKDLTRELEKALGAPESVATKPEMYERPQTVKNQNRQHG